MTWTVRDKLPWPILQWLSVTVAEFSLSWHLELWSWAYLSFRGQTCNLLTTPSSVLSKPFIIYISFAWGHAHLWHLTVLPMTASLVYILFFFHVILKAFIPPPPPLFLLFTLPCHECPCTQAVMVLISLDCEDCDWTVAVVLGFVQVIELCWRIGQEEIRFIHLFFSSFLGILFWVAYLNACCWVCLLF